MGFHERHGSWRSTGFLVDMFRSADPTRSGDKPPTLGDLLDHGVREFSEQPELDPLVKAQLCDAIGRSYQGLGRTVDAERQLALALSGSERTEVLANLLEMLADREMAAIAAESAR